MLEAVFGVVMLWVLVGFFIEELFK